MKTTVTFLFLIAVMSLNVFAQSPADELDKIKQIKLLESTRKDVERILKDYKTEK